MMSGSLLCTHLGNSTGVQFSSRISCWFTLEVAGVSPDVGGETSMLTTMAKTPVSRFLCDHFYCVAVHRFGGIGRLEHPKMTLTFPPLQRRWKYVRWGFLFLPVAVVEFWLVSFFWQLLLLINLSGSFLFCCRCCNEQSQNLKVQEEEKNKKTDNLNLQKERST